MHAYKFWTNDSYAHNGHSCDSLVYTYHFLDVVCLAGRVYKDKFISSNYEDKEALDKSIEWYKKAFELSPLEYSGINLTV